MDRDEQWREEIRGQLEKIGQHIRDLTPPRFHLGPQEPTLAEECDAMEQKLLVIYRKMERGMQKLVEILRDPIILQTVGSQPHLIKALGEMVTIASVITTQMQPSLQHMANGETLQEILGVSDETLRSLYTLSRYLYEHQHYEEACGAFYLLSLLSPSYPTFWMGLGNCEYLLERYQEALSAYAFASQVDPSDPSPHILIARCHLALGNLAAATASVSVAELSCTDRSSAERVRKQAEQVRKEIQRYSHGTNS
jgi:type III secretion system low calcium response chaperone LcrH/SycD